MVKELEDMPHDEVAVLLDAHEQAVVGESFDVQVRAAGSILRAHALRGRRSLLTITSSPPKSSHVASFEGEWRIALELLATVEPNGTEPVARFLDRDASGASQAGELVVVTGALDARLTDALLDRAFARQPTALVLVDTASFGAGEAQPLRDPALLRLHAAGVPAVTLRRGDNLVAKLSGFEEAYAAHG
jgi:hypothetical protein